MIWECPKCGREYDGIKINGFEGDLVGFVTESNNEIYLYCFNEGIYDEPYELLMKYYESFGFYCTNCNALADKRTTIVKEVVKNLERGFQNKKRLRDLV
jgi:hypothetical protein